MKYLLLLIITANLMYGSSTLIDAKSIDKLKLDNLKLENIEAKNRQAIEDWQLGRIKFKAYKTNYLAYSYLNDIPNGNPNEHRNFLNSEIKFQFSVRGDVLIDIVDNYDFLLSGTYTQISNWQQFIDSSPFRDTNYEPELFFTFPMNDVIDFNGIKLKNVYLGYKHSSNGLAQTLDEYHKIDRELSQSRSWNRLYVTGELEYDNLFFKTTYWKRLSEDVKTDDNPDIMEYYGWGEMELNYVSHELVSTLSFRKNIRETIRGSGGVKLSFTYPLIRDKKLMFYTEMFHGYGYSLIDYDKKLTQFGIGIAVSR